MAKVLIGSDLGTYSFNKVTKQIRFDGFTPNLERFLLITDVTNNKVIYQFNNAKKGGVVNGQVLTLDFNTNTSLYNNSDQLQIFYYAEDPQSTSIDDIALSVKRDLAFSRRDVNNTVLGTNMVLNSITSGLTLSNVTTVANVTSLSTLTTQSYKGPSSVQFIPFEIHMQMRNNFNIYKNQVII